MANWQILKTAVVDAIKTNGNQEITGKVLQNVLNNIISSVGENATFAGIATPATNPGTPDGPVFYIASKAGTYSNFNTIVVNKGEVAILKNTRSGSWQKISSGLSTEESVLSLRNYIFVGGNTKADRWVNAGLFDFIFDAYFDIDLEAGFWYHFSSINKQNKSINLYKHSINDDGAGNTNAIIFKEYEQIGDYTLMYNGNSYVLVNWNLYLTDDILLGTLRSEGTELNPMLFRTNKIKLLRDAVSKLQQSFNSLSDSIIQDVDSLRDTIIQDIDSLTEQETIAQSYIQLSSGTVVSSGTPSTTVGVYNVEEGKKYHVQYMTGNQYTRPYAFYNTDGSVLSDDNTFPEITSSSGINVNFVLIAPLKATTLKITYNNTASVAIAECTESYVRKIDLTKIENKIDELETTISGLNISETVKFTAAYRQKELSFTIPKGSVINLSGDITQITCRTNSSDATYQTVTNGTVADRDINYVKNGSTSGSVTISVVGQSIPDTLQAIQESLGYTKTPLTEQETIAQSYIQLSSGTVVSSGTPSTTVGVYNISTEISVLAISMCTGNQYTRPYAFYDANDSVLPDDNTFPEIPNNGGIIVSNVNLSIPKNAVTFKITYNNTAAHTVSSVTKNFVIEAQLQALSNRVDGLEQSINASKEGAGIAYRVSSKFRLRPLKILGVGNSWTNNATAYLGNILSGLGVKVEINVSYAGGATLQSYWNNIKNNAAAYQFRKWREGQGWIEPEANSTYKDILLADDWDILTHQQQSGNGGNYSSFQPYLHDIINWEKSLVKVMPLFFMHATWAYPNGYDNEQFETLYGSDTTTMYNAILSAYNQAMVDENIVNVMPSAPMIQQVRTLGISDIDTADGGSHLSINGQFAVACVWAEMIFRNYFDQSVASELSIVNSTYKPGALSDENAITIRNLAKTIVENVKTYFPNQQ